MNHRVSMAGSLALRKSTSLTGLLNDDALLASTVARITRRHYQRANYAHRASLLVRLVIVSTILLGLAVRRRLQLHIHTLVMRAFGA